MKYLISKAISCFTVAAGLLTFVACSSSSTGAVGAESDSGVGTDSAAPVATCDAGGGGNLCTSAKTCGSTVNGACTVTTAQGTGNLPAFTGGAIADGTYFLTSVTAYGNNGTAGQTQRITMTFAGGAFTLAQDSDASCNSAPTVTGTTSTAGTQLTLSVTCPATDSETLSYSATPTTFSYSVSTGATGDLLVFTRQ